MVFLLLNFLLLNFLTQQVVNVESFKAIFLKKDNFDWKGQEIKRSAACQ